MTSNVVGLRADFAASAAENKLPSGSEAAFQQEMALAAGRHDFAWAGIDSQNPVTSFALAQNGIEPGGLQVSIEERVVRSPHSKTYVVLSRGAHPVTVHPA